MIRKLFAALAGMAAMIASPAFAQGAIGYWEGTLRLNAQATLRVGITVERGEAGDLTGTIDSPDQNAFGIALAEVENPEGAFSFAVPAIGARRKSKGWRSHSRLARGKENQRETMIMGPLPPTNDDRAIWDMWESQFRLPVATVADEVGTFRALGNAPMTTAELARGLEVDERALGIHLGALAASGLVEKRDGKWSATPAARQWLHPDAEGYWGGFLYRFRETIPMHAQLLETLKTGKRPQDAVSGGPEWERGSMSQEAAERIAKFMHAHSMAPARGAAMQPLFGEIGSLMDVGCGSGVYGIEIAKANPALNVTLLDLKEMCTEAEKFVQAAGLTGRVTTASVNMFEEDWPTGHDAHFFANVFHDWSEETNGLLAKKSFDALPSGGRILLSEVLMDDDGTGPWPAAAFSLMMLVGTLGKQYSLPEFREILESAGFTDVRAARTGGGYYSLVSAVKP